MLNVIIRITLTCIVIIIMNLIYQIYYTYQYHNGNPVLFFPDIRYSLTGFIIFTFIIGVVFEKLVMNSKWHLALLFGLLVTVLFYSSATIIENKHAYLYEHYYQRTPFTDLTHLKEYSETKDNYITLGKALKNEGVKIKSIQGGYTDVGYLARASEDFQRKLYYINDDIYIIFDWDEEKITAQGDQESIRQAIDEQYGNFPEGSDIRCFYSAYNVLIQSENVEDKRYYIIEPTEEDTFKIIENQYIFL